MAWVRSMSPCAVLPALLHAHLPSRTTSHLPGMVNVPVSGSTPPVLIPNESTDVAVTSLNVDPGAYSPCVARFNNGACSDLSWNSCCERAVEIPADISRGSNVGYEAMANRSPVWL